MYSKLTDTQLKDIYTKPIKDGVFSNAQMSYELSDKQVIPLIKKYLKGQIKENEISKDFIVPLYQKFAKSKGKDIIAFDNFDFGGSTEYVVSNIKKYPNLNDAFKKAQKTKSQLTDIWKKANGK